MQSGLNNSNIYFFSDGVKLNLKNRRNLKAIIVSTFLNEKKKLRTLNYIFCNDKKVLSINKQYLNHNFYTDIITFDLSEDGFITGEIYISLDRVKDNAKKLSVSTQTELARVIFHGALHLCGYKDKRPSDIHLMRKKEDELLDLYLKS